MRSKSGRGARPRHQVTHKRTYSVWKVLLSMRVFFAHQRSKKTPLPQQKKNTSQLLQQTAFASSAEQNHRKILSPSGDSSHANAYRNSTALSGINRAAYLTTHATDAVQTHDCASHLAHKTIHPHRVSTVKNVRQVVSNTQQSIAFENNAVVDSSVSKSSANKDSSLLNTKKKPFFLYKRLWVLVCGILLVIVNIGNTRQQQVGYEEVALQDIYLTDQSFSSKKTALELSSLTLAVHEGETFGALMQQHPFGYKQVAQLLQNKDAYLWLAERLRPGAEILITHENWLITQLRYPIDKVQNLLATWNKTSGTFDVLIEKATLVSQPSFFSGTISTSFYLDALAIGMPDSLIASVANIYQWDIDFVNDIRIGDTFEVLYLQEYLDGEMLPPYKVLAAEFVNRSTPVQAVAYIFSDEEIASYPSLASQKGQRVFYTPQGESLRKAFLRMPLKFGRVSSRFNPNRVHPLFGTKRPHRGTDYAAPRHTPILSVGNGKVRFVGWGKGYGRYVTIDHGRGITTLYAHMQAFAKGVHKGVRVQQGQRIGSVGTSGWATGPHVHFEFRVNGKHKNPETVLLPKAPPLPNGFIPVFQKHSQDMMAIFAAFKQKYVRNRQMQTASH